MRTQACALTVLVAAAPCTMIRIQKAKRFKHLKLLLRKQRLNNDGTLRALGPSGTRIRESSCTWQREAGREFR